jgi:hypothetical protein
MAIAQRSEDSGRARSRYDRLELYEIVRDVALAAVERTLRLGEKLDPLLLTQDAWDAAREWSGYPDAPSARQVCWRLRDQRNKPFPWRELLELVFDLEADIQQVEVARTRRPRLLRVAPDAVWYSLRRVAGDEPTLTLSEYAQGYQRSIREDRRRRPPGTVGLEDVLLTPGQVLHECGSWPDALRRAGLEVRGEHYTAGRVSLHEAALRFTQEIGALPTPKLLRFFAKQQGFALENIDHSRTWATRLQDIRAYISEQGLPEPPEYVPAQTAAAWSRWLEQQAAAAGVHDHLHAVDDAEANADDVTNDNDDRDEEDEEEDGAGDAAAAAARASLTTLDLSLLDAGRAERPRRERAYQPKRFWRLRSEVLEQLRLFLEWELPSADAKRTTTIYKHWSQLEPGRPSLDSVQKFAPLHQMLREARRPDAVKTARAREARDAARAPQARVERLHQKHVESRRGQELIALLRQHGEMGRRDLERELGWPQRTVSGYLKWLIEAGAIEKLGPSDRLARYRALG